MTFQERLEEAIDLNDEGKYRKALGLFNKLVKEQPAHSQARFERAMVLMNLDQDEKAAKDLEKVLEIEPGYPGAKEWLARASAGQGKLLLAAETLLEALPSKSDVSPQKWADCARHFLEGGEAGRARQTLETYFAEYEPRVTTYACYLTAPWRLYASILAGQGEPDRALEFAERAAAHPNKVPADDFMRIQCLAHLGRVAEARESLEAFRPEFEGALPFDQAEATLRGLGC
ncbi:MAG: tetratricopeptide repeat protein [Vulcanimicrobiota bacterium]